MDFLKELEWRGMLHDATPGVEQALSEGKLIGYIGFDPTAPSLTIGNYVQLMLLTLFQRSGHQPIVLMGGATGRIGDPSGKDKERELKTYDELEYNLSFQVAQVKRLLNCEQGDNRAIILNNYDFYKNMNVLDFLRDAGKTLTVNYMMSKDSVKNRLEGGLSFTEFSYQLLQAYDYQLLFKEHGCRIQMGGSDQWGNITSGTEFIRRNLNEKAYAVTTPLLTKADGSKFGKSSEGNIWLDANMTSPYQFYQFWLNADDADIPKFTRYFTLHSESEILDREAALADKPQELKRLLAQELTVRVHSEAAYQSVLKVTELLFSRNADQAQLNGMSESELAMVAKEIPSFELPRAALADGLDIAALLSEHTGILASKGDVRRAIKNKAISVNKAKVDDHEQLVRAEQLLHGKYLLIENGKKNKHIITAI